MTIDPRLGVVVAVPPASRRGWADPRAPIEAFLRERERWVVRHVDELARERDSAIARGGARDGGLVPFRGELHRVRVVAGMPPSTSVDATTGPDGPELVVRLAARERRSLQRVLEAWLRERAREAIDTAVARYAAALGVRPRAVDLRDPRSRWGSASRNGRLMFSWRLVLAPPASLETVVVHELAHLRVFGHGPAFWALVAANRPTHLADRAWLRRNAYGLHAALLTAEAASPEK
ncbi:MAG TPA: SprT family zinc-dependent metalloprotease [Candidatus Binatia bacterium]|nr:SprT family zinc-dependent metalloprotease [Candidatus Binatia bacterium]